MIDCIALIFGNRKAAIDDGGEQTGMVRRDSSAEWHVTLAVGNSLLARQLRDRMLSSRLAQQYAGCNISILAAHLITDYATRAPARLAMLEARSCIVALVDDNAFNLLLDAVKLARGYVFAGYNLHLAPEIAAMALQGYVALPLSALSAIMFGRQRLSLLTQFSSLEMQALRLLRNGCSDRQIAEQLQIGIAQVKYLTRTVMRKLRFRNRTRTAVFAARYIFPIVKSA